MTRKSMAVLAAIGLVDSISYMSVAPSLFFYVEQVGGTKEQYGFIMSAFSFASFCGKPVYGLWVDRGGNKFRVPYLCSFLIAITGALMYFFAASFKANTLVALAMIFFGRTLSGLGGANQTLGYAYIATSIKQEDQTTTNSLLAMTRILGMAMGPAVNAFLDKTDITVNWLGPLSPLHIDPLNAVGLLLALGNALVMTFVFFFLDEPPEKEPSKLPASDEKDDDDTDHSSIWKVVTCIEILLPLFILLVVNSSFQLIETALPLAAADGLGWGPVQTSGVLGSTSFIIFGSMCLVMALTKFVSDTIMVALGNIAWMIGGTGMFLFWVRDGSVVQYVLPVMIACSGFPFIAASNRSNYTKAVSSKPELENSHAVMQAVLSMSASVAGFLTPSLVAAYVVRTPEQVTASADKRELTVWALYTVVFPIFILIGLFYLDAKERKSAAKTTENGVDDGPSEANEFTQLIQPSAGDEGIGGTGRRKSSVVVLNQAFSRRTEVSRRHSVEIMGISGFDTHTEKEERQSMLADMEEWAKLAEMDFEDEPKS